MAYIEPVLLDINSPGEKLSPGVEQEQVNVSNWPDTYNWALNKVIDNSFNVIDRERIKETIETSLDELFYPVREIDESLADYIRRRAVGPTDRDNNRMVIHKENKVLLPCSDPGHMFIISDYKNNVVETIDEFNSEIEEFSDIASDFGLDVNLKSGSDFAKSMSSNLKSEIVRRDEFDNTLEESVHSEISDRVTTSIDANITLKFGEDDPEIFEYDLLLHAGTNNRIVVEVKDASHEDASLGKNELIDRPRDKTNIIESNDETNSHPFYNRDQTEVFVIVKHMEEEDFDQQKQKAERRDIHLLKYEDGDYLQTLENQFRIMTHREL